MTPADSLSQILYSDKWSLGCYAIKNVSLKERVILSVRAAANTKPQKLFASQDHDIPYYLNRYAHISSMKVSLIWVCSVCNEF